jgi:hypothetical protein
MRISADDVRRLKFFSTRLLEISRKGISTPEARQSLEHLSIHLSRMATGIEETNLKKTSGRR